MFIKYYDRIFSVLRFELVVLYMRSNLVPAVMASLFLEFASVCVTISLGSIALIRFLCQINITVMEEQIGEITIRVVHALATLITAIVAAAALLASGDILTGSTYNILTASANTIGGFDGSLNKIVDFRSRDDINLF